MGSIVAFDVLSDLINVKPIDALVTIGSPLGVPVIVGRIFEEQKAKSAQLKKPSTPDNILNRWFNMSDVEDKVALDHTLNDDFTTNNVGVSAQDITVVNDYEINGELNPHKSFGYLRTPEMANIIHEFLITKRTDFVYQGYKLFADKLKRGFNSAKDVFARREK